MITKLDKIILKSGLKKQAIAQEVGISTATLRNYSMGKSYLSIETRIKLAEILKVDVSVFFLPINDTDKYYK